jgi:pimeloyl-ACP methyl ester carboxylesterase
MTPGLPGLEHGHADLGEVRLHYVTAGKGEPLVLLHGWPQTWFEWRHVLPALAAEFRVVAPDLRGLGDSSRPSGGYDKRTMAQDIARLLAQLGIDRFCLVGHDWGGPVAFALAMAQPDKVRRLAILDVVIPGDGGDFSQGGRRWHHAFHMTGELPEALVSGRERLYLQWFYRNFAWRSDAIGEAEVDEYLRTYSQPAALRAGFELYRALPQDRADNAAAIARGKLKMPVLAVGGGRSFGRGEEVEQSLRRVAENVTGVVIPDCGHWIPEEQPELLLERLLPFLREA